LQILLLRQQSDIFDFSQDSSMLSFRRCFSPLFKATVDPQGKTVDISPGMAPQHIFVPEVISIFLSTNQQAMACIAVEMLSLKRSFVLARLQHSILQTPNRASIPLADEIGGEC
jgi:hypothetical protein